MSTWENMWSSWLTGAAVVSATSAVLLLASLPTFVQMYSWIFHLSMYWLQVPSMSMSIESLYCALLTSRYSTILNSSMLVCISGTVKRSNSDFSHSHDKVLTKAMIASQNISTSTAWLTDTLLFLILLLLFTNVFVVVENNCGLSDSSPITQVTDVWCHRPLFLYHTCDGV